MSYDVDVLDDWFNFTSNMRRFFVAFDVYPPDWDGLHRCEVAKRIRTGLENVKANQMEALSSEYDAPNGWGNVEDAVDWLEGIAVACERPIVETVRVSS